MLSEGQPMPTRTIVALSGTQEAQTELSGNSTFRDFGEQLRQALGFGQQQPGVITYQNERNQKILIDTEEDLEVYKAIISDNEDRQSRILFTPDASSSSGPTTGSQDSTNSLLSSRRRKQPDVAKVQQAFDTFLRQIQPEGEVPIFQAVNSSGDLPPNSNSVDSSNSGLFGSLTALINAAEEAACIAATGSVEVEERIEFEVRRGVEHFVHRLMRGHPPPPPHHFPPHHHPPPPPHLLQRHPSALRYGPPPPPHAFEEMVHHRRGSRNSATMAAQFPPQPSPSLWPGLGMPQSIDPYGRTWPQTVGQPPSLFVPEDRQSLRRSPSPMQSAPAPPPRHPQAVRSSVSARNFNGPPATEPSFDTSDSSASDSEEEIPPHGHHRPPPPHHHPHHHHPHPHLPPRRAGGRGRSRP